MTKLFDQYGLRNKIIAYVKDEGSNLNTMTIALKFVVKYEIFGLDESFQGVAISSSILRHFGIAFELSLFTSNIRREVCGVWDSFLFF